MPIRFCSYYFSDKPEKIHEICILPVSSSIKSSRDYLSLPSAVKYFSPIWQYTVIQSLFVLFFCTLPIEMQFKPWWYPPPVTHTYVTIPPRPHKYVNLFETISLYGRWSTSGSDRGIVHFFIATRNTIKGVGGKRTKNKILGLTQGAREGVM